MIWVDAHLSPALALWITTELKHPAQAVRDLGLRQAKDPADFCRRPATRNHHPHQRRGLSRNG